MRAAICTALAVLSAARLAHATPYETFVDVDDEGDLADLLAAGVLTDDTYNELLDLLGRGVDLATADRNELYTLPNLTFEDVDAIIAYRQLNRGRIKDPAELVTSGALSEEKLLGISSFIIVREPGDNPLSLHGWVRAMTRMAPHDFNPYSPEDPFIPPVGLRTRFTALKHLTLGGALTTTRMEIGEPVYDPTRGALVAADRSYQIHVPKVYARWDDEHVSAMLGSYRAGFGQRLVFDNTNAYSPNGLYIDDLLFYSADLASACKQSAGELIVSPCVGPAGAEYVTPDFAWRENLFGGAIGAKKLELATGWMQAYAFASVARKSFYQYELVNASPGKCTDPHDDSDPDCAAPDVFVKPSGDLLTASPRHAYTTLPNVFQERLVGGNVAYFADRRNSVGLTAYGAQLVDLVDGIDLSLQEWSRYPFGNKFGAVGANFSFGRKWLDVFGEAAASFDSTGEQDPTLTAAKGGGGPAAVIRVTATRKREELEVVGRYYSTDYLNPHSRPISQPDEFEGQRARDEAGARIRYIRTAKEMTLRALLDVWTSPSDSTHAPKLDTYVRANVQTTPVLWLGLWERYQDKNLKLGGHDQCFEISNDTDESGEPIPCAGRQLSTTVRATYKPDNKLQATLQLQHQLLDDNSTMERADKFRQDLAVWFIGHYRPNKNMRLRIRGRFLDEAINDNTYLERSFSALADGTMRVRDRDFVRVRIDTKFWLDKRMSTQERVPNPELMLWLFYEARL